MKPSRDFWEILGAVGIVFFFCGAVSLLASWAISLLGVDVTLIGAACLLFACVFLLTYGLAGVHLKQEEHSGDLDKHRADICTLWRAFGELDDRVARMARGEPVYLEEPVVRHNCADGANRDIRRGATCPDCREEVL
jgi:hypothetical protein